jgi:hypothetical protein
MLGFDFVTFPSCLYYWIFERKLFLKITLVDFLLWSRVLHGWYQPFDMQISTTTFSIVIALMLHVKLRWIYRLNKVETSREIDATFFCGKRRLKLFPAVSHAIPGVECTAETYILHAWNNFLHTLCARCDISALRKAISFKVRQQHSSDCQCSINNHHHIQHTHYCSLSLSHLGQSSCFLSFFQQCDESRVLSYLFLCSHHIYCATRAQHDKRAAFFRLRFTASIKRSCGHNGPCDVFKSSSY